MMPAIRDNGDETPVELPMGDPRPRYGRTLDDSSARKLRDMLAKLLIDGVGCTSRDAAAVLGRPMTPDALRRRVSRCPVPVKEILWAITEGPGGGS
jgi:hypothetical protein